MAIIANLDDLIAQAVVNKETELTGADGKSAYELAVDGGFVGTQEEWLASLIGATPILQLTYNATTGDLEFNTL